MGGSENILAFTPPFSKIGGIYVDKRCDRSSFVHLQSHRIATTNATMVFAKKRGESYMESLDNSCGSLEFEMDDHALVRGREASDGAERKEEKRRSRSRSAVRKLANVFNKSASENAAAEDEEEKPTFVPPTGPLFQNRSPAVKQIDGEHMDTDGTTDEDVEGSDKARNNDAGATFELEETPIRSPQKERRRWRSRSSTRGALDRKFEMAAKHGEGNDEKDEDESSHHGSVVASVVSMFEFISPKKNSKKQTSAEAPAELMTTGTSSPSNACTEKKPRSWFPKSPGRSKAKERAVKEDTEENEPPFSPSRPSVLAAPSLAHMESKVGPEKDVESEQEPSSPASTKSPPRRRRSSHTPKSPRHSLHARRRRRSKTPEQRYNVIASPPVSPDETEKDNVVRRIQLGNMGASQESLLGTESIASCVSGDSDAVALPPNAFGNNPDTGTKTTRPRVRPASSILKSSQYGGGSTTSTKDTKSAPKTQQREVGRSTSKSEHGTSSSSLAMERDGDVSKQGANHVSHVKNPRRSSTGGTSSDDNKEQRMRRRSPQGETRSRGRSRQPSASASTTASPIRQSTGGSSTRRSSSTTRPSQQSSISGAQVPRRRSASKHQPTSQRRAHSLAPTDLNKSRRSRDSSSRSSPHRHRPASPRTPGSPSRKKKAVPGENLQVSPLAPEVKKELIQDIMREVAAEGEGSHSTSPRSHKSRRSKSVGRTKSPTKGTRKKAEASNHNDSQKLKVRIVKKHRSKPEEEKHSVVCEAAQLQIEEASESILDVDYCEAESVEVSS